MKEVIAEIVEKFEAYPYAIDMGKGRLSSWWKFKPEDIVEAKKIYRSRLKEKVSSKTDVVYENYRLKKTLTKARDLNRINNKDTREKFRYINTLEELQSALIQQFDTINFNISTPPTTPSKGSTLIVQLSDTHFNELVNLPNNKYDFEIAAKRLRKYFLKIRQYVKNTDYNKIILALTGDLINSDRRLDEKAARATNRMKAALIATNLLQYFINDLLTLAPVDVVSVSGNESRVGEEFGYEDINSTDNYDFIIVNMLKLLFGKSKDIKFVESHPIETVINIYGNNILITHGTNFGANTQKSVQQVIGKYSSRGISIQYVLFGHIHFANITDLYARSGSLVGNNAYADHVLNVDTRPSQPLTIVDEDGSINNIRVDLSQTEDITGYDIKDDIAAYNAKSASKALKNKYIIKMM